MAKCESAIPDKWLSSKRTNENSFFNFSLENIPQRQKYMWKQRLEILGAVVAPLTDCMRLNLLHVQYSCFLLSIQTCKIPGVFSCVFLS